MSSASGATSSRARPASVAAAVPTLVNTVVSPPKGRVSLMQVLGCGVLIAMSTVVVYMYNIIDGMHREQEAMRLQLAQLTGATGIQVVGHPHLRSGSTLGVRAPADAAGVERPTDHAAAKLIPGLKETDMFYTVRESPDKEPEQRRLNFMATVGTGTTNGCYQITDSSSVSFDVSSATACGPAGSTHPCPDCFTTATMSQDIALTIQACSSAKWTSATSRSGIWAYTFINPHSTYTLSVTDNSGSGTTFNVAPGSFTMGFCATSLGTSNKLYYPSYRIPTLTVDSGVTMSAGNFDASGSSGSFSTSKGTNTLYGNTVISGSKTFTTGTGTVSILGTTTAVAATTLTLGVSGSSSASTTLYGDFAIDSSSTSSKAVTIKANVAQSTTASYTFSTSTGGATMNGDIAMAAGTSFSMAAGTGSFSTATGGTVYFNGDTTITSSYAFTTGSGTVSLKGDTYIDPGKKFTVGTSASAAGATTVYGAVTIGATGTPQTLTLIGAFSQSGAYTFSTGTGAVSLNGDVTVVAGKSLWMDSTSTGTFQTGVGTATFNGNVQQAGSYTFSTGTGAVSLNGATYIANNKPLTVGTSGYGGTVQLFGAVTIGGSTNSGDATSLTVYGDVEFKNDAISNSAKTLKVSSTGGSTFYGDVTVANGINFAMIGAGTFTTGTGAVSLQGDTTVSSGKFFKMADQPSAVAGGQALQCQTGTAFDTTAYYCRASR